MSWFAKRDAARETSEASRNRVGLQDVRLTSWRRMNVWSAGRRSRPEEGATVVSVFGMAHSRRIVVQDHGLSWIYRTTGDEVRNGEGHTHASSLAATMSAQHKPTEAAPNAACSDVNCSPYSEDSWSIRP